MLADGVLELAAAGQGAHDGRAAADVGAVADHDALRDAAFDHGDAEGARIEVHEAGVHDGGAFGQVRAQSHAVGVADAHAGRHDVVDHAGELVNRQHVHIDVRRQHGSGLSGGGHHVKLAQSEIVDGERTVVGPHHVVELGEDAVEIQRVRLGQTHAQQVQTQIGVGGVLDRLVQLGHGEHGHAAHATRVGLVMRDGAEVVIRTRGFSRSLAQREFRIPHVKGVAGRIDACQAPTPCGALFSHVYAPLTMPEP